MKILHVIPSIAPRYGGPSQVVVEMSAWLKQKSHQVDIVTTNADGDTQLDVALDKWMDYKGARTRFFHRNFSEAYKYSKDAGLWLRSNIAEYDVVNIHAVFSYLCVVAAKECLKKSIPYVIRPLGTLDPWSMSQKPFRKRLFLKFAAGKMLTNANAIHYTTELERQGTEKNLGIKNGVVIPNGINIDDYEKEKKDKEILEEFPELQSGEYLLYMGRISEKKNIEKLLESFSELKIDSKFKELQLVLAGDGESYYVRDIKNIIEQHPNQNHIHATGWVSGIRKKILLQNALLFVLPSMNENYGVVAAESLASAVPVVLSDQVYLHPEIEKANCGWIWNQNRRLSQTLTEALDSNDISQRGLNGKKLIEEKFQWSELVDQLVDVYAGCLKA